MFEELYFLDAAVHLICGCLAFRYAEKFLTATFENRKRAMLMWAAIYAAVQMFVSELTTHLAPHDRFISVIPFFALIIFLQGRFFAQDKPRQIFVAASFAAGWEILRFIASPLSHAIFSLWSPLWAWALNSALEINLAPADKIIFAMEMTNRAAIFFVIGICRAVQIAVLIFYLRMISKSFRRDYELTFQDSLFLILPCATVLLIDLTLRLMAFSVDNSAFMLIYERVPATILLLPIVSLLLIGIIISSVMLFQNLIRRKDEEQKRLLLENRAVEINRQVQELSDIYADIRGLKHDLRGHIENIAAYIRGNSELENYLDQMKSTVERLDFADKTGNALTDIILHQARQSARKNNIKFSSDFHFVSRFDAYDISVILNNALTNALENSAGEIQIRSYERGSLYFIEVENNFSGALTWNGEIPATTKRDKKLHGIGLTNIRRCAQKYLGDIDIEVSQNIFRLTVMLYKKAA